MHVLILVQFSLGLNDIEHSKVLILGAGASGLAAAKTLNEKNISDFIVLEGSGRIGGRVRSVRFGGTTVEAGANWMAVREGNPLWDIIRKFNVSGKTSDGDSVVIRTYEGSDVTDTEGELAWRKLAKAEIKLNSVIKRMQDQKTEDMSLRSCLDIGNWHPKTPVEKVVEIYGFDYDYGAIPDVSSCYYHGRLENVDDSFYVRDDRGYEFILKKYVENALPENDQRILLNETVTAINYTDTSVSVTTVSGNIFVADFVIVTFSIGVLKSGSVTFNPPLPDWKIDNLFRVRLENYESVYLKFPDTTSRFWDDTEFILYADKTRGVYPVWQNLEAEGLFPVGTNILQIVTYGEEASRISRLTARDVKDEVMTILRRVYGNVTEPEDVFITGWKNNPLYKGSYCNMETGAQSPRVVEAITAPVGRIYFAGEAYSRDVSCYVTGAVQSGIVTAKKVTKCSKGTCEVYDSGEAGPSTKTPTVAACPSGGSCQDGGKWPCLCAW
ncbi:polyamine oxidase 7-like isoform X2 [Haliotis rubra]|uniref:polyamine oxidase 7-like isoform X2 n=1 Tax=Haliotis rubra TaxID=36100 RepID=UPI001EE54DD6|nr:polyamine oxidase 7-like isoform X2 [Haliotis rubra]